MRGGTDMADSGHIGRTTLLFVILFVNTVAHSQWVQTNGPTGSNIISFATLSSRVFAGTEKGAVFQSTNTGVSWSRAATSLSSLGVRSLTTLDAMLFAATGGAGIFRTVNYGGAWAPFNGGLTDLEVNALTSNETTLFAGTVMQGVFRWMGSGNWMLVFPAANVRSLVAFQQEVMAGVYGAGVFRSTDNGTSWSAANTGLTSASVQALAFDGTFALAATANGIFRSSNRGTTWSATDLTQSVVSVAIAGGTMVAGTTAGRIYRSTDAGITWNQAFDAGRQINALIAHNSFLFAGIAENGAFRSTDGGVAWFATNAGITNTNITRIAARGNIVVCIADFQDVFRSSDTGDTWNRVMTSPYLTYRVALHTSNSAFFVGTSFDLTGGVLRSPDGLSWASVFSGGGITGIGGSGQDVLMGATWLGGSNVYRSTNNGDTWNIVAPNLAAGAFAIFNGILFAGNYRSTDNGTTWVPHSLQSTIWVYAVHDSALFAGTASGAFRSTDAGATWMSVGFPDNLVAGFVSLGNTLFAAAAGSIHRTTNNGASWTPVNEGLAEPVTRVAASATHLYVGTSTNGVWRRPLSQVIVSVRETSTQPFPGVLSLEQNYPNPFNTSTTIAFTIPVGMGHVPSLLKIYDMLGREVATLIDEILEAGGHTRTFHGEELGSGVYYYQLKVGGTVQTKKLILLK